MSYLWKKAKMDKWTTFSNVVFLWRNNVFYETTHFFSFTTKTVSTYFVIVLIKQCPPVHGIQIQSTHTVLEQQGSFICFTVHWRHWNLRPSGYELKFKISASIWWNLHPNTLNNIGHSTFSTQSVGRCNGQAFLVIQGRLVKLTERTTLGLSCEDCICC